MVIVVSAEPEKHSSPIVVSRLFWAKVTELSESVVANAESPKEITLLGISI
jgi:hypothetical protein